MDDRLPVSVKPVTRTGAQYFGQARRLGLAASKSEVASKHDMYDGYLFRAVRKSDRYLVYILDPPAMLLFAGHAIDTRDELGSVGNRDEFQDKDSTKTYKLARETAEETQTVLPVPTIPPGEADAAPTVFDQEFAPQVYEQGSMAVGYRRVPMALISSLGQMDTYDHFTYAQNVSLGLSITVAQASMSKTVSQFRSNYYSLNTFWVGERQMTDGWSLQARRLIDRLRYAPNSPYNSTRLPICLMSGGAVIPAVAPSTEDRYVVVAEAVRQSRATWSIGSDTYYDLVGERGVVVARGIADREDFDSQNPVAVRARLDSLRYITASDLPRDDIKPKPANYYGFPASDANIIDPANPPPTGVPLLPTYSWWLNPHAVRYTDQSGDEGFATFCVYWGPNHATASNDQPLSFGRPDPYMSAAIVVIDESYRVSVLKADLNDISYTSTGWQPIEGADKDKFVNPWLIGVESVLRVDAEGVETRTGYALVWEEWQMRGAGGSGFPDGPPPGETATNDPTDNITLGGEFALYSIGKEGLQRTVLSGDCAAMMHPNMGPPARFGFPVSTSYLVPPTGNTSEPWFTDKNGYGACYYMGDNKLVTACIPNERYYMYTYSPGTSGNGSYGYNQQVDAHPVSCAVIDTVTGAIEVRGVIAERTWSDQFCTITCAQWTIPAKDDKEERPAVLFAGFHTNIKAYFQDYNPPSDCTYISIDGGWTWRLYVEDAAGEKGQFLVGNQLWANDPAIRFDSGEKAT